MRLSTLQQFILGECHGKKGRVKKKSLLVFYDTQKKRPRQKDRIDAVTKSIESLIEKELLVGYGVRTPKKWFIEEVRLMPKGHRMIRDIMREKQQRLPLKHRSSL